MCQSILVEGRTYKKSAKSCKRCIWRSLVHKSKRKGIIMDLKFLAIFLLLGAVAYAAPSNEVEDDDAFEMDDTEASFDDLDEDVAEEDPKRRQAYFSKGKYCACKKNRKGDEPEMSEDEVDEHLEDVAEDVDGALADPKKRRRRRKKNWHKALKKLVGRFFRRETLRCYCTTNKAVVRLLNYLHLAHHIHMKQKAMFIRHVKYLVAQVSKQKSG